MRSSIVKAYLKKEFIDLIRSKMLIFVYLFPSLIIFLFGYGLKLQITDARTVIIDRDNSILSRKVINSFEHSKYFDTKLLAISDNKALKLMKQNKIDLFIIIPSGFEKNVIHSHKSEVGIFIDGSFPMRAITLEGYVKGMFLNLDKKYQINLTNRNLFNESLKDANAIIPGIIGLTLLIAPAILAALLIVKEKENGTIFNFYSSNITKGEFLLSKLTPVFLLHYINVIILFLWAVYWFDVPFKGSFLLYLIASAIYIITSIGIGLLVSIITSSQVSALVLVVLITVIPGFLYSGILMPISSMNSSSFIEAHLFPIMYYNHIVYDTFLVGIGFHSIKNLEYLFILFLYGSGLVLIGSLLLRKGIK